MARQPAAPAGLRVDLALVPGPRRCHETVDARLIVIVAFDLGTSDAYAAMAASSESLFIVLLTGGGLAVVGSVVGQGIASRTALSREREARREARRLSLLDFRREAVVSFQDALLDRAANAELSADRADDPPGFEFRMRLLLTRIGDSELEQLWQSNRAPHPRGIKTAADIRNAQATSRRLIDRTGELIREIDQASTE
jgi:hypothetical protein